MNQKLNYFNQNNSKYWIIPGLIFILTSKLNMLFKIFALKSIVIFTKNITRLKIM